MSYSVPIRLSCRLFPYSLAKINAPNNFHPKSLLTTRIIYPTLSSVSRNQQYFLLFSSENKIDEPKGTSKLQAEKVESTIQDQPATKVNQRTKLKQAIRDYGTTIVVFHVAISLTSLGLCYLAVSSGVDAVGFLKFLGVSEAIISSKVAVEGSTFVMSYAVHKVFAPVRIGITLSVAPFIVRYLRKINLLKPPKTKV